MSAAACAVWWVGVVIGWLLSVCAFLSDWMADESPRTSVALFSRRALVALVWPIGIPVYLCKAWRRDEW